MASVNVCDATGDVIPEGEENLIGWGVRRVYGAVGFEAYQEYEAGLKAAAASARKHYDVLRDEAMASFLAKYPTGKLPDTEEEEDG